MARLSSSNISPTNLTRRLIGFLPEEYVVSRKVEQRDETIETIVHMRGPTGQTGRNQREFNLDDNSVYHSYLTMPPDLRASQNGRRATWGAIQAYERMGFQDVHIFAALQAGPYTWARMGFIPEASEWEDLRTRAIPARLDALDERSAIDPQVRALVERALQDDDPSAIWKIVDFPGSWGPNSIPIGRAIMAEHDTLGPPLRSLAWPGEFNIGNRVQRARLDEYAAEAIRGYPDLDPNSR